MMMKSVFWWRKPEHPEETTDLRQVTDETFSHLGCGNFARNYSEFWRVPSVPLLLRFYFAVLVSVQAHFLYFILPNGFLGNYMYFQTLCTCDAGLVFPCFLCTRRSRLLHRLTHLLNLLHT